MIFGSFKIDELINKNNFFENIRLVMIYEEN